MSKKVQTFHDYMQSIMNASSPKKINKRGKMAKGDYQTGLFGGGKSPAQQAAEQAAAQRAAQAAAQAQQRAAEQAQQRADAQANQRAAQARAAQQTTPQAPQAQSGANGAAQAAQVQATKPVYSAPTGNGAAAAAQLGATTDPEARRKANALRDARQRAAAAKAAAAQRAGTSLGAGGNANGGQGVGQWINNSISSLLGNFTPRAYAADDTGSGVTDNDKTATAQANQTATAQNNQTATAQNNQTATAQASISPTITLTPSTTQPPVTNTIVPTNSTPPTPTPTATVAPLTVNTGDPAGDKFVEWLRDQGENATKLWNNFVTGTETDYITYTDPNTKQEVTVPVNSFNTKHYGGLGQYLPTPSNRFNEYADPRPPEDGNKWTFPNTAIDYRPWENASNEMFITNAASKGLANSVNELQNLTSSYNLDGLRVPRNQNILGLSDNTINELATIYNGTNPNGLSPQAFLDIQNKAKAAIKTQQNAIGTAKSDYNTQRIGDPGVDPNNTGIVGSAHTYIKNKDTLDSNKPGKDVESLARRMLKLTESAGNVRANNLVGTAVANLSGTAQAIPTPNAKNWDVMTPFPTITTRPTSEGLIPPTPVTVTPEPKTYGGGGGGGGNTTITGNGSATAASAPYSSGGIPANPDGSYPVPPEYVGTLWEDYFKTGSWGKGTKESPMQIKPGQTLATVEELNNWKGGESPFYAQNPIINVVPPEPTAYTTPLPGTPRVKEPLQTQVKARQTGTADALTQTAQATAGTFKQTMTPTSNVPTKTFAPSQNFIPSPTAQPQPQQSAQVPYSLPGFSNLPYDPASNFLNRFGINPFGAAPRMSSVQSSLSSITPTPSRTAQPTQTPTPSRTVSPTQTQTATPSQSASNNAAQQEIAQILNDQRTMQQQAASAFPQFASTGPTKQARMSPSKKTKKLKKDIGVGTGLTAHATQPVPESPMPKIRTIYGSYKFKKPQQQRSAKYGEDQQINQPIRKQINPVQPRQTMQNVMPFPPSDTFQPFAKMIGNPMDKYEKNDLTKSLQQTSKYNNAYSNKKYEK